MSGLIKVLLIGALGGFLVGYVCGDLLELDAWTTYVFSGILGLGLGSIYLHSR
jgi:hypothetical protein